MSTQLKTPFQTDAVNTAVETFLQTAQSLKAVNTLEDRRTIIQYNGCMLIEAPTGAGKTLIAGNIANKLSEKLPIVWFWFAPLKGLTGQAESVIRDEFSALRICDAYNDRDINNVKSGDIWVVTWASVATSNVENRQLRQGNESNPSLDTFIPALRSMGYFVGVVIDEAHHGFQKASEAQNVYRDLIDPDFSILITATPNDKDIEQFKQAVDLKEYRKIIIGRQDCVDAGIIKKGVRAVAFTPIENDRLSQVADLERLALKHGSDINNSIRSSLQNLGIELEPLLLVQVESRENSVNEAKDMLIQTCGFSEKEIAIHTAAEPDPDVLAIAKDESVKVLIFKMAVALGFDAPRAFTLVSLRKVRDANFGLQIVGRIMRVDRRLQDVNLPEDLNYGYVMLTDFDSQTGLISAADKINHLVTDLSGATPNTRVTIIPVSKDLPVVQVADKKGRLSLFPEKQEKQQITDNQQKKETEENPVLGTPTNLFELAGLNIQPSGYKDIEPQNKPDTSGIKAPVTKVNTGAIYSLRTDLGDVPLLLREECPVYTLVGAAEEIALEINFSSEVLLSAQRRFVNVFQRDIEIFTGDIADSKQIDAQINKKEIKKYLQQKLFEDGNIDPRELHKYAIDCLKSEMKRKGLLGDETPQELEVYLALIIAQYPKLLDEAKKRYYAKNKQLIPAESIPERMILDKKMEPSILGLYKAFPPDLGHTELEFARLIDTDTTGTIKWWFRSEDRKPWSAKVLVPDLKDAYFPDFVIKVNGRKTTDSIILVEVKGYHIYQKEDNSVPKARAEHMAYKKVMMVTKDPSGVWHTVENDESGKHNRLDREFSIDLLRTY